MRPLRRAILTLALLGATLPALALAACSPFDDHRQSLERLHATGRYDLAADTLDEPRIRKKYGRKNEPLWLMDRGAVALALDNYEAAIATLDEADEYFDRHREATPAQSAAALILNDRAVPYYADPWEDMYLNVLKLLAQLERGVIVGGATVEARRLALKANLLRDRYLTELDLEDDTIPGLDPLARPDPELERLASLDSQGEFIESPLGLFLSAIAFMEAGEPQNQAVAARRLQEAIAAQGALIGDVDPEPFEPLETLTPAGADVLVVALSGRGPTKRPYRFGPIPIGTVPIYFELPVLKWDPSEVASTRVLVETIESPAGSPPADVAAPLFPIENFARVADVNHRRALPLIYTRTLLRAAAKSTALTFANEAVRNSTDSDAALIGAILGSLVFLAVTERADLRTWVFLPGQAHVGLLDLGPGVHRLQIEYLAPGGGLLYASAWRTIEIEPTSDLQTIVEHFWR